jgi:hypothetical protein
LEPKSADAIKFSAVSRKLAGALQANAAVQSLVLRIQIIDQFFATQSVGQDGIDVMHHRSFPGRVTADKCRLHDQYQCGAEKGHTIRVIQKTADENKTHLGDHELRRSGATGIKQLLL